MPWWKFWEKSPPDGAKIAAPARSAADTYRESDAADEDAEDSEASYESALGAWLAGYASEDDIMESLEESAESDDEETLRAIAATVARARAEAERRADAFPAETDNDKLSAAFATLERTGIVARENFTCCMTCGGSEIAQQIDEAGEVEPATRGYVFFHQQDTEAAVEGGGLFLAFGSVDESPGSNAAIGREACEVLSRHGLTTHWDGTPSKRIVISLKWQRRPGAGYPPLTPPAR